MALTLTSVHVLHLEDRQMVCLHLGVQSSSPGCGQCYHICSLSYCVWHKLESRKQMKTIFKRRQHIREIKMSRIIRDK